MMLFCLILLAFLWGCASKSLPVPHLHQRRDQPDPPSLPTAACPLYAKNPHSQRSYPQYFPSEPQNYEPRSIHDFKTRDSRLGFIRKVYGIFTAQLMGTIGVTAYLMTHPASAHYIARHFDVFSLVSLILSVGICSALVTVPKLRHTSPANYLLLAVYTLAQALLTGTFASFLDMKTVCLGTLHTLTVLVMATLFSYYAPAKYDLTPYSTTFLGFFTTIIMGMILASVFNLPLKDNVVSGLLAIMFVGYITKDVQEIMGGKKRGRQYGSREHILAALGLYQDTMAFFMEVLKILMKMKEGEDKE